MEVVVSSFYARYGGADWPVVGSALPMQTQKAVAVAVGFALAWMAVPTVGKRVFLLAVSAIPTVIPCMTTAAATVKKAAIGRKKSPPLAVKKQLLIGSISPAV